MSMKAQPTTPEAQEWYTTAEAAKYLRTSVGAVLNAVWRKRLVPDCQGRSGRSRSHMFRRETLEAYYKG
jgi:hypothetical protein